MDGKPSCGTPVPDPGSGHQQQKQNRRKSSSGAADAEEEEESEDPSSSSPPETPVAVVLDNFRRQWEAELKTMNSNSNLNENSALNLSTTTSTALSNPYLHKNPTSMAGAVSISKGQRLQINEEPAKSSVHPFATAKAAATLQVNEDSGANSGSGADGSVPNTGTIEEQARRWFLQGIGFERHGDLYDAVRCYRRAVQLVPDIEYRISQGLKTTSKQEDSDEDSTEDEDDDEEDNKRNDEQTPKEEADDEDPVLVRRYLKQIEQRSWLFFEKIWKTDKAHISDLPVEVVSYIMRWVVSNDLDIRSLDVLSTVCKGFYCITRDEKLWQMACSRVWGPEQAEELSPSYTSFREMFIKRPRVRLDGCYISRITYIRPGETSFQDQFYRPWHFVQYYRYIRFFPDGNVHFLTSSEEPNAIVPGLREKHSRNTAILKGKYQLYGNNIVTAMVKKPVQITSGGFQKGKLRHETQQQTSFHIEFEICPVKGRSNWMLKWVHHAVFITKTVISGGKNRQNNQNNSSTVTSTTLDISPTKYPPLLFSRVKSYTTRSESILE